MVLLWEVIFAAAQSHASKKNKRSKKDCQCILNLNFDKTAAKVKYNFSKPELCHSHALTPINILIDGKEFIKLESDLTDTEVTCIQNLALCYFSIPMLETNLERIFPDRAFDKTLLSRMRDKALDNELGKDRHNLPSKGWINHPFKPRRELPPSTKVAASSTSELDCCIELADSVLLVKQFRQRR
jgi:hypothetical protein